MSLHKVNKPKHNKFNNFGSTKFLRIESESVIQKKERTRINLYFHVFYTFFALVLLCVLKFCLSNHITYLVVLLFLFSFNHSPVTTIFVQHSNQNNPVLFWSNCTHHQILEYEIFGTQK